MLERRHVLPERVLQGAGMALARVALRTAAPLVEPLSRSAVGRAAPLAPLTARAWSTSPEEAISARGGFADSRDHWRTLLWGLLLDVPRGLDRIDCPVTLVQGVADRVASGQTVRYLRLVPASRSSRCCGPGARRSRTGRGRSCGWSRRPRAAPVSPRTPPR